MTYTTGRAPQRCGYKRHASRRARRPRCSSPRQPRATCERGRTCARERGVGGGRAGRGRTIRRPRHGPSRTRRRIPSQPRRGRPTRSWIQSWSGSEATWAADGPRAERSQGGRSWPAETWGVESPWTCASGASPERARVRIPQGCESTSAAARTHAWAQAVSHFLGQHKFARAWQGSIPGNRAHVGLMRLLGGRRRASATTCSLKGVS